jgi:catechol 2,3-dioxygenase-like lactoylglutathione lyase family enzyme
VQVEKVDFVGLQTQDVTRSKEFYVDVLGLPFDRDHPAGFEVFAGQVCLSIWNPANAPGVDFAPSPAHLALNVGDVATARAELEAKGVVFDAPTLDTGVCHMAFFHDPDGNALMLHRRYAPYA